MIRKLVFSILAGTFLAGSVAAQTTEPTKEDFTRAVVLGKKFFEIQDYASALEKYQAANEIYPDQPGILYNLALLLARLGRVGDSQAMIDRYLQLFPKGTEVPLIQKLEYELEFRREVEKKQQANKEYVELFNRAKFLLQKGEYDQALKLLDQAEQIRATDEAIPYNQAVAYEKRGDFLKATERLRRYLELSPAPADKNEVDARIFALESEITDMREKIVCPFCGFKLAQGATWCHRCWHGPYLTTTARWNTRLCDAGATATRQLFYAEGRLARNEDLSCILRKSNFLTELRYTPAKKKAIQAARIAEGWKYEGDVLKSRIDRSGSEIRLQQGEYLERLSAVATGEVLDYAARRAGDSWLLDREEVVIEGQLFEKTYTYDPKGRILQERVSYVNRGACDHPITVVADYAYGTNDELSSVNFKGSYVGHPAEGAPDTVWTGTLTYAMDAAGRVEREEFVVTSHNKTWSVKPIGNLRGETEKLYRDMRANKKPLDIMKIGDRCATVGTQVVGNQIDLRPFYTISPNIGTALPFGVVRMSVSYTYPEDFMVK